MKTPSVLTLSLFLGLAPLQAQDQWINLDQKTETELTQVRESIKTDSNLVMALYQITYDATQMLEKAEVPYSFAFGTLLGQVRNQGIIPHDDDVDLMIDTADGDKLMSLKSKFWDLGYDLFRESQIVGFKLYSRTKIKLTTGEEILPFIDLFEFGYDRDCDAYVVLPPQGRKLFHKAIIPTTEFKSTHLVPFGQITARSMVNPAVFLTPFYGTSWQNLIVVSHKHNTKLDHNYLWTATDLDRQPAQPTGPLKERVSQFYETGIAPAPLAANNHSFWNDFYSKQNLTVSPSTFAQFLADKGIIQSGKTIVDIATGNGRDTLFFLTFGMNAVGIDASTEAIKINRTKVTTPDSFQVVDINDQQALAPYLTYDFFYARFFIHSISEVEQHKFMNFLATMKQSGKLLLEFRTDKDPMFQQSSKVGKNEGVTNHYRRYINFAEFCQSVESLGFKIDFQLEADNLSVRDYEDPILGHVHDNPWLGRIVATKL